MKVNDSNSTKPHGALPSCFMLDTHALSSLMATFQMILGQPVTLDYLPPLVPNLCILGTDQNSSHPVVTIPLSLLWMSHLTPTASIFVQCLQNSKVPGSTLVRCCILLPCNAMLVRYLLCPCVSSWCAVKRAKCWSLKQHCTIYQGNVFWRQLESPSLGRQIPVKSAFINEYLAVSQKWCKIE